MCKLSGGHSAFLSCKLHTNTGGVQESCLGSSQESSRTATPHNCCRRVLKMRELLLLLLALASFPGFMAQGTNLLQSLSHNISTRYTHMHTMDHVVSVPACLFVTCSK
jgi:hypothetical protein